MPKYQKNLVTLKPWCLETNKKNPTVPSLHFKSALTDDTKPWGRFKVRRTPLYL